MRKLDLYLARHVLGATLAVLLIIGGLDGLFALVDQLEDLTAQYRLFDAMQYIALTLPGRLYEFIPMSALIGCLLGLGALATHAELTVMRAAGISVGRIIWGVMKPVLMLVLFAVALGEFVVPTAEQSAESFRSYRLSGDRALAVRGVWHRDGETYIHINSVARDGQLHGVTRYEFGDDNRLLRASFATYGHYVEGGWQLEAIRETRFAEQRTQVAVMDQEHWEVELTPELLSAVTIDPLDLSISGLWRYTDYLNRQGLSASNYELAFWNKSLLPLSILALVLVAVSFIFGPLRSVTVGQRLVAGIIVGMVFKLAQDILGPASTVFGFPPVLSVLLPIVICLLAGSWLLKRAG
ncbi:MAG: LPS export ABC transporter permease LptG [Marinobacterium sp.]|nr:LPS export ABC transporter permease LptG [Marinobacterium sp.]